MLFPFLRVKKQSVRIQFIHHLSVFWRIGYFFSYAVYTELTSELHGVIIVSERLNVCLRSINKHVLLIIEVLLLIIELSLWLLQFILRHYINHCRYSNFTNAHYNFVGSHYTNPDACYNFSGVHYTNTGAYFIINGCFNFHGACYKNCGGLFTNYCSYFTNGMEQIGSYLFSSS